jgi:hypothetical protein
MALTVLPRGGSPGAVITVTPVAKCPSAARSAVPLSAADDGGAALT